MLNEKEKAVKKAIQLLAEKGVRAELGITWCNGERILMIMLVDSNLPNLQKDCIQKE